MGCELENVGYLAFAGSGLEKIIIPDTVIEWECCHYDTDFTDLPNGGYIVNSNGAFAQCYNLSEVIMGNPLIFNYDIFTGSFDVNIHCIKDSGPQAVAEEEGIPYKIYSEGISAKSIKTQRSTYTVVVGEEMQLYPIIEPQNTTDWIWWISGNAAVKGETASGKVCTFVVNVVSSGTTTYDTEPTKNIALAKMEGLGNRVYTGSAITPNVSVLFIPCRELIPDVDYTISYINNKNIGTATVGSLKQKTSYSTTSITMSWKKVSNATGYEVYRATSKKGKYTKVKTTTSITYKQGKLTRGKTYYYKVRAYKSINGSKIYGNFSSVKAMGTKPKTPSITLIAGNRKANVVWKKNIWSKWI